MLIFSSPNSWFSRFGLALFCAQLWLFVICLPPFRAGTWFQTEPAMVTLFSLAGLSAAWLAIGVFKGWLALERPVHPLIWVMLAWVAWQFVPMAWSPNPYRVWFGIPQTGEGAGWNAMLLVIFLSALPLWRVRRYRNILFCAGAAALAVMAWLHLNLARICDSTISVTIEHNPLAPGNWPDYMAFIAGWLWIAYATTPHMRTPSRHGWVVIGLSVVLLVATNHAAHFFMFPAIIGAGVFLWLQATRRLPRWLVPGRAWKWLAVLGVVLPFFWALTAGKDSLFPDQNCMSMQQRAGFNQAFISAIEHEPCRLAVGKGWGSFGDDFFESALFENTKIFRDGNYHMNWIGLMLNVFHPHNQPMAALLATGLPGMLLFLAIPLAAIWRVRRPLFWWCVPMVLALNTLGYVWFVLPQVLAFQALGLAALCCARKAGQAYAPLPRWLALPMLLAALVFAWSSLQQYDAMRYGSRFEHILDEDPNQPGLQDWLAQDVPRGGDRLIEALQYHAEQIALRVKKGEASLHERDWFQQFLTAASNAASGQHNNARLAMLEVKLALGLFRIPEASLLDELKPHVRGQLDNIIVRFSARVPRREDFTAPFFISLDDFTRGDREQQQDILLRILEVAPNHRSALWLLGGLYEQDPATAAQGADMKRRAATLGVNGVLPVTKEELAPYLP